MIITVAAAESNPRMTSSVNDQTGIYLMLSEHVNDIKVKLSRFSGVKVNLEDWENDMVEVTALQKRYHFSVSHNSEYST